MRRLLGVAIAALIAAPAALASPIPTGVVGIMSGDAQFTYSTITNTGQGSDATNGSSNLPSGMIPGPSTTLGTSDDFPTGVDTTNSLSNVPLDSDVLVSGSNDPLQSCSGDQCSIDPVPEPASLAILGAALAGFVLVRRRRGMNV